MKLYLYTLVLALVGCAAQPQQPRYTYYRDYVVQCPNCVPMPAPLNDPNYWNRLREPYNPNQIIRVAEPVQLPNQQQVMPLPGQSEEQRRQMQSLIK